MTLASQSVRLVGRYLLCDEIGHGGMATIHLARLLGPEGFSRTVVVKQLHPQFARDPDFVAMFLDEARLAVRIRHANVVSPLDIVATGTELLIVMDYVAGESLATLLRAADGPLAPAIASAVVVQVLLGLHAAHEATREQGEALGLVHRDVSPQNILVGQDGAARVLDFGIAKAAARSQTTGEGKLKGKIGYMAPEQLRLEAVDRRADVFTTGIVLWEALTGRELFVADSLGASVELILRGELAAPSTYNLAVPPELDALVLRALAREPSQRFPDALSMAKALQRIAPPASVIEVIHWVEGLVGPELAHKQELVRRAESLSPSDLALVKERSLSAADAAAEPGTQFAAITQTAIAERVVVGTERLGTPPAPTGETTGLALGADREPAAATGAAHKRPIAIAIGVGAALALSALALATALPSGKEVAEPATELGEATTIHAAMPGGSREVTALATPVVPVVPPPRPVAASSVASSVNATPSLQPRSSPPASAQVPIVLPVAPSTAAPSASARVTANVPPAQSPRAVSAPHEAARGIQSVPTANNKPASARVSGCDPPWIINAKNVKVFKEECLR